MAYWGASYIRDLMVDYSGEAPEELSMVADPDVVVSDIITHAPVHINDLRGVRARYVKRTGYTD